MEFKGTIRSITLNGEVYSVQIDMTPGKHNPHFHANSGTGFTLPLTKKAADGFKVGDEITFKV